MQTTLRSSPARVARAATRWQPYSPARSTPSPEQQASQTSASGTNTTPPRGRTTCHALDQARSTSQRSSSHSQDRNMIEQVVHLLTEIWEPYTARPIASSQASAGPSRAAQPQSGGDATLMPIRNFVYHILRRSRTTSGVLQSAMCYIEGVRGKLPGLAAREAERTARGARPAKALRPQLTIANISQLDMGSLSLGAYASSPTRSLAPPIPGSGPMGPSHPLRKSTSVGDLQDPTAAAPSPLLCPRRTFLAALVLAHKFILEKCYSNRAWAKIAGLPPREVGRCERALGEALDWRLWVGKGSVTTASATQAEMVVGARSEPATAGQGPALVQTLVESGQDSSAGMFNSASTVSSASTLGPRASVDFYPHAPLPSGPAPFLAGPAPFRTGPAPFLSGPATPSPETPGLSASPSSQASSASPASVAPTFEAGAVQVFAPDNEYDMMRAAYPWMPMTQGMPAFRGESKQASIVGSSHAQYAPYPLALPPISTWAPSQLDGSRGG
ncbi:hypothetical protein GGG16DRAFT_124896 [Schizophyllum commune]